MSYYLTFGEYDFLTVIEAPSETQMAAVLLSAAATGRRQRSADHAGDDLDRGQRGLCRRERSGAVLSLARRNLSLRASRGSPHRSLQSG